MEDLWKINLNNTSQDPLNVYLYGTLTEQNAGLIASATTSNINLSPGVKIIRVNELEPISVDYPNPDPKYRESLIRTGNLPTGNYEICVYVRFANTNHSCGFDCIQHSIEMIPSPTLISPSDGETIVSNKPVFSWMQALRPGIDVRYKIKIVEIRGNQSPEIAMETNPTWFEENNIMTKVFLYPVSARELVDSNRYAWQVESLDPYNNPVGENDGKSEVNSFFCDYKIYRVSKDTVKIPVTTIDSTKDCLSYLKINKQPKMDGGLINTFNEEKKISRDDYIPLNADGLDYDLLIWTCAGCKSVSSINVPLSGKVEFKWKISEGEGSFVKVGGLPKNMDSTEGNNVIFKPPYVPLKDKVRKSSGVKKTIIMLTVIDAMKGDRKDPDVTKKITITTKRLKKDSYSIKIEGGGFSFPSAPSKKKIQSEPCTCKDNKWKSSDDLKTPTAKLPPVEESNKLLTGEWIVLEAPDHSENDILPLECLSTDKSCPGSKKDEPFEDNVQWQWTVPKNKGTFIIGFESGRDKVYKRSQTAKGRFIIYEAPQKIKGDELGVSFFVKTFNEKSVQLGDKVKKDTLKNLITVIKPGVKLTTTPLEWLPEKGNFVSLTSKLVYRDGDEWKPAPKHAGRIHYFELMNVSREPGITMNYPIPSSNKKRAEQCRDLQFKDEDEHEAFNYEDKKFSSDCGNKKFYVEARTKNSENEYTIKVHSTDYGSYGFTRSFANINKSFGKDRLNSTENQKPYFIPVPVNKDSVTHPQNREKKKEYKDNRVTIPRDIDENHIADNGWEVGDKRMKDPEDIREDKDDKPKGDGFDGDGLTGYEEYRGFMVFGDSIHTRTNTKIKDLFIFNPDSLPTNLFESTSRIIVHRINEKQFIKKKKYYTVINFNYLKSSKSHIVDQCGLQIMVGTPTEGFAGWTYTTTGNPTPPNWVKKIVLKSKADIKKTCVAKNLNFNSKMNQLVAHELAHGVNVYHHGEMKNNNKLLMHGLRSGHLGCIMRYDNIDKFKGEFIGNIFCDGVNGTGDFLNRIYGSANYANGRGTCLNQIRISGLNMSFPKRDIKSTIKKYVGDQKMSMRKRLNEIEKRLSRIRAKGVLKEEKKKLQKKVQELRSKITKMENLDDVQNVKKEIDSFENEVKKLEKDVGG
jgi:hypothetical protein